MLHVLRSYISKSLRFILIHYIGLHTIIFDSTFAVCSLVKRSLTLSKQKLTATILFRIQCFYGGVAGLIRGNNGAWGLTLNTITLASNERIIHVNINWGLALCSVSFQTTSTSYGPFGGLLCISSNYPGFDMSQLLYLTGTQSGTLYKVEVVYFA